MDVTVYFIFIRMAIELNFRGILTRRQAFPELKEILNDREIDIESIDIESIIKE